ncbi:uncharacterized protein LOC133440855 [Cololabis saira]|uniref:uncharacterized protein LOC133440855 n=1 Tax=Cololabis saira TaxID=129043 RepID=UPI002AD3E873|nr:uncharacterized protein LOC133440855 [Cololabis saira]
MSKVNHLREFLFQRLTAAAVEIFSEFEKTMLEFEEELDRQRRLLDLALKPEIRLHRVDLPQENVCKVEEGGVFSGQHLDNLERSCSPDQEEPGHPQTTELEEDSSGQEMKQEDVEVDVSLVNVADVKVENNEPGPNCGQLLLHTSPEAQYKDEEGTESLRSDSHEQMPAAPTLPVSLPPPDRAQVQYQDVHHVAGKRRGEKRRIDGEEPELVNRPIQPKPAAAAKPIAPRVSPAPVLLVVPAQPQAPSMRLHTSGLIPVAPPLAQPSNPVMPRKSSKPCGACKVPQCGGQRKRYTPSKDKAEGSSQKIFTFCPATKKSTTSGFDGVVYNSFQHFKNVVDEELRKRKLL